MSHFLADPERALAASWMFDPNRVGDLDRRTRGSLLTRHAREDLPRSLYNLVDDLKVVVGHRRWFVSACVCSLIGEFIYASVTGGIYQVDESSGDRDRFHAPLCALRNTCFHPARLVEGGGTPLPIAALLKHIERHDKALSISLERDRSLMHGPGLAAWAIQRTNDAGRYELGERVSLRF